MKNKSLFRLNCWVCSLITIILAGIPILSPAQGTLIWNGPVITYTQPGTDTSQAANQDRLTPNVWLTRGSSQGLFNAAMESFFSHNSSPAGTEWAFGTLANYNSLTYQDWEDWFGGNLGGGPQSTIGQDAVLHLISDDIYLSIKFTSFGGIGGGFSYTRSTPSAVPEPQSFAMLGLGLATIFFRRRK